MASEGFKVAVVDNMLKVSGEVLLVNAMQTRKKGEELISTLQSGATIDLSEVNRVDSSCVSVLLCWLRYAKKCNLELVIKAAPDNLLNLFKLCDLGWLDGNK